MASGIRAGEPTRPRPADGLVERGGYAERGAVAVRYARGSSRLCRQAQTAIHDNRAASAQPESEKLRRQFPLCPRARLRAHRRHDKPSEAIAPAARRCDKAAWLSATAQLTTP